MIFCPIPTPPHRLHSIEELRPVGHSSLVSLFDEMRRFGLPKELHHLKFDIDMYVASQGDQISNELQEVIDQINDENKRTTDEYNRVHGIGNK